MRSLINLNKNPLCVVHTLLTKDEKPKVQEMTFMPLDHNLKRRGDMPIFKIGIRPDRLTVDGPNIVHGDVTAAKAEELFYRWFHGLQLKNNKKLSILAFDWITQQEPVADVIGDYMYGHYFQTTIRDTLGLVSFWQDASEFAVTNLPFGKITLNSVCKRMGLPVPDRDDTVHQADTIRLMYIKFLEWKNNHDYSGLTT